MWRGCFLLLSILGSVFVTSGQSEVGFIEARVDNLSPYVGEAITYTFVFYDAGDPSEKRFEPPNLTGFGQIAQPEVTGVEQVDGQQYTTFTQETILFPAQVGTITIPSARVILPESPFQPEMILETEPIVIEVLSLPANAPDSFKGAVGTFEMDVLLNSATVRVGELQILTVSISGLGNLEQIPSPTIAFPEAWNARLNTPTYSETNALLRSKQFDWVFVPNSEDIVDIPTINFSYFNPENTTYQTITSSPITLTIEANRTETITSDTSNIRTDIITLKHVSGQPTTIELPAEFWLVMALPLLPIFLVLLLTREKPRYVQATSTPVNKTSRIRRPQQKALRQAQDHLDEARNVSPTEAYALCRQAIFDYFARRLRQSDVTQAEIQATIQKYPKTIQLRVFACLKQAESGQYAPVTINDAKQLIRRTQQTLAQLDGVWS